MSYPMYIAISSQSLPADHKRLGGFSSTYALGYSCVYSVLKLKPHKKNKKKNLDFVLLFIKLVIEEIGNTKMYTGIHYSFV